MLTTFYCISAFLSREEKEVDENENGEEELKAEQQNFIEMK